MFLSLLFTYRSLSNIKSPLRPTISLVHVVILMYGTVDKVQSSSSFTWQDRNSDGGSSLTYVIYQSLNIDRTPFNDCFHLFKVYHTRFNNIFRITTVLPKKVNKYNPRLKNLGTSIKLKNLDLFSVFYLLPPGSGSSLNKQKKIE